MNELPSCVHHWMLEGSKNSRADAQCVNCGDERSFPSSLEESRRVTLKKIGVPETKKFNASSVPSGRPPRGFAKEAVLAWDDLWNDDSSRDIMEGNRYKPIDDSYE